MTATDRSVDGSTSRDTSATRLARVTDRLPALAVAAGVLALWEGAVRAWEIRPILLPTPSSIAAAIWDDRGRLVEALWTTGRSALLGLVVGSLVAFAIGAVAVRWRWLREGLLPVGVVFGAVPIVATAPIFNLWFGTLSVWSNAAVVALVVFFPVLINTIVGLASAPAAYVELMASYAAPQRSVFTKLRLPAALPFLFGALRVAVPLAVIAAVVADFFGGLRTSSGFFIKTLMATADYTGAWATVAALCGFGLMLYGVVALAERSAIGGRRQVQARSRV